MNGKGSFEWEQHIKIIYAIVDLFQSYNAIEKYGSTTASGSVESVPFSLFGTLVWFGVQLKSLENGEFSIVT